MARSTRDTTLSDTVAAGVISGALAAGLFAYAALYGEAAWSFAQAEPRYRDVTSGEQRTVVELDALTRALRATPARRDLGMAADLQIRAAEQIGVTSFRAITRLSAARRDLRLSLAASPVDALAWTRLAVTEMRLGHRQRAVAALTLACRTAPVEPDLAATQLDVAVALWPHLTAEAKAAIEQRMNWVASRPDLKPVANGKSVATIRAHLAAERSDP